MVAFHLFSYMNNITNAMKQQLYTWGTNLFFYRVSNFCYDIVQEWRLKRQYFSRKVGRADKLSDSPRAKQLYGQANSNYN